MFREGPVPAAIHSLAEYLVGGLFIALPLVLGYDSGAATAASIIIGVLMIGIAASTDSGLSLNNQIPKAVHFAIDWILAAILIASPFLFGFSDESTPTAIFVVAGVFHLLLTIGTRFGEKRKAKQLPAQPAQKPAAQQPAAEQPAAPAATTGDRRGARRS